MYISNLLGFFNISTCSLLMVFPLFFEKSDKRVHILQTNEYMCIQLSYKTHVEWMGEFAHTKKYICVLHSDQIFAYTN